MNDDIRRAVLSEAQSWIGTPYLHQASLKGAGTDCLGLLRGIWRALYGHEPEALPYYKPDWAERGGEETLFHAACRHLVPLQNNTRRPGDVILFRFAPHCPAKHCAVLARPGRMIHAWHRRAVCETALGPWWERRTAGLFAFPEHPEGS